MKLVYEFDFSLLNNATTSIPLNTTISNILLSRGCILVTLLYYIKKIDTALKNNYRRTFDKFPSLYIHETSKKKIYKIALICS